MSIPKASQERIFLPRLEDLWISDSSTLHDFTAFQNWKAPRLKEIDLSRHIELYSFKGIDPFVKMLERLSLTNMEVYSFQGLMGKPLPNMHHLTLNCVLSDRALEELHHLDSGNVKKLSLSVSLRADSKIQQSTGNAYQVVKDLTCFPNLDLPNVTHLTICCCTSLAGLEQFHMPRLKVLDLRDACISEIEIQTLKCKLGSGVMILSSSSKEAVEKNNLYKHSIAILRHFHSFRREMQSVKLGVVKAI